jgi:hypothetical protein
MLLRIIVSIMSLTPLITWAYCDSDIAEYYSKNLSIFISSDCIKAITIDVSHNLDSNQVPVPGSIKEYSFFDECKLTNTSSFDSFSCHKDGHTPLAGATYKLMLGKATYDCSDELGSKNTPHKRYMCIAGCVASVPEYLEKPDSCD